MLLLHSNSERSLVGRAGAAGRRGAALMVSILVLLVLIAIVFQITIGAGTDARVTRNVVGSTQIEWALESGLLRVYDELAQDAANDDAGGGGLPGAGGGALGGAAGGGGGGDGAAAGLGGAAGGRVDSRQDDWATPRRTRELNDIELRILVQDEDSKINLLGMLTENEEEAQKAFDRVVRVLDFCREGTSADIDGTTASEMARVMKEVLLDRTNSTLPKPVLLTDNEEAAERSLPMSLREFVVYDPFEENHFRDFRDDDGTVVHSIESFLTMWTALRTLEEELQARADAESASGEASGDAAGGTGAGGGDLPGPGQQVVSATGGVGGEVTFGPANEGGGGDDAALAGAGEAADKAGIAVNVNTAPRAVLESLFDDRDVERRFWSEVVEYRNLEEENEDEEDTEPLLDEFGEEIIVRQIFRDVAEVSKIDGYEKIEPLAKKEIENLLTVRSDVFSLYLTGRRRTGVNADMEYSGDKREREEQEEAGDALTISMRCIVWRRQGEDGFELVPLVRWEVLDYVPFEVLDFPGEER